MAPYISGLIWLTVTVIFVARRIMRQANIPARSIITVAYRNTIQVVRK
jgi:hypothetical protein